MNRPAVVAILWLGWCLTSAGARLPHARGDDPPPKTDAQPDAARQQRIAERDRIDQQVRQQLAAGQWKEAITSTLEMLKIEREVFGDDHDETDGSRGILASTYAISGDFDAARRYADESLTLQNRLHGGDDWRTRQAQNRVNFVARLVELDAAARDEVSQAAASHQRAMALYRERKNQQALDIEQQAAEVLQKHLGDALAATAECWYYLGQIRRALEKYDEAFAAWELSAAVYKKALGAANPQRANCLLAQGLVRRDQQKLDEAVAALRLAYEMRKEVSGAEDTDTRYCQSSLATVLDRNALDLEEKNDLDVAHKHRQESLELKRGLYPQTDWRVTDGQLLLARNVLLATLSAEQRQRVVEARKQQLAAAALYRQGKSQEALKPCRQAYDTRRDVLGAEHQDTALSANLLGLIANEMKDFARAEAMLRDSATIWRKLGGCEYPEVATPVQNLAELYERQSKFAEAKKLTEEAWKIRSQAYGDQDEDTHRSLATLVRIVGKMAAALENAGNYSTAEETRRELVELTVKLYGEKDWRTTDERIMLTAVQQWAKLSDKQHAMLNLATQQLNSALQLNGQSKGAEAQPLAEKALATRETLLGDDNLVVIHARQVLIASLRSQGKYADAELASKQYAQSAEQLFGPAHPRYAGALETWGHVLYNQNKYGAANELYRKAFLLRRQAQGNQDDETNQSGIFLANSLENHADALLGKDDFAAAKTAREQALEVQMAVRGPDAYQTHDARFALEYVQQLAGFNIEQRANLQLASRKMADANRLNGEKKFNAAVEASEDAVRLRKEVLGDKHRLVAIAIFRLGVHVNNRGDNDAALKMLLANQELLKTTLGPSNPDYAYTLVYMASMYRALNDLSRAAPLLRDALDAYTKSNGTKSEEAIGALDELVVCLQQLAAAQLAGSGAGEAKQAWQEIVALTGRRYGETSSQASDAKWGLYRTELWPTLKANQRKELLDSDKWMTIAQQKMKEANAQDQGDHQKDLARGAMEPAGYAVQLRQQVLGDGNPATADALDLLAEAQTIAHDGAAAMANYQKALAIRRKTQGETHPAVAKTREALIRSVAVGAPRPFERLSKLTAAQKRRLAERDRLFALAERQYRDGQFDAEYRTLEQMLRIEIEVYGDAHEVIEGTYERLLARAESARASQLIRANWVRLGEVRKKLYGPDSWQAVEARVALATNDLPNRLNAQQSQLLDAARKFHQKLLQDGVQFDTTSDKLQPALNATEVLRKALLSIVGENHLYYANCLEGQAAVYRRQGNEEEADALMRKAAEIVGRVLTTKHPMYATRMNKLGSDFAYRAEIAESKDKFDQAYELWRKRVDLMATLYGAEHWQVTNARLRAGQSHKRSKIEPETRTRVDSAIKQLRGASVPVPDNQNADTSLKAQTDRVALLEKQLGTDDLDVIDGLFALATQAQAEGKIPLATTVAERALLLRRRVQGANHPATARNTNFLGLLWYLQADFAKAEPLLREALQVLEQLGYTDYPVYSLYLNNLAVLYEATGDFDRAEPLLRAAVNVKPPRGFMEEEAVRQETFEEFADDNEVLMGQFNLAEVLHDNVGVPQEPPPNLRFLGQFVNNLALLSMLRGDFPQAETLLRQSLDLMLRSYKQVSSAEYLNGLTNLAAACERQGDLEQAELLTEFVVQEYRRLDGFKAKYAIALNNLGAICLERGDAKRSIKLRQEALQVQRDLIGERHPTTILTRANLALLADRAGNSTEAAAELDAVLGIATANLQLAASVQSERQQLRMNAALRGYLDHYLSVAERAKLPAEQVYKHVLAWKGMVSARQWQIRARRQASEKGADPAIAKMHQELAQANQQLAALSFGSDQSTNEEAHGQVFAKLSLRKDELERDLAAKSALFDRQRKAQRLSPAELKALLPAKAALVDLVEYEHAAYSSDAKQTVVRERRLAAFVLRSDADIVRIELGPAEPIEKLVDRCRESWLQGRAPDTSDPAAELKSLLWLPFAEQLAGATTVLVSPDGAASRVPLAALPGRQPDTYLLEDLSIAVLPVPQLLGEVLAGSAAAISASAQAGLLLMGDVDFDAEPGKLNAQSHAAARDGQFTKFGPLPGTLAEVQAVGKLFSTSHKQPAKVLEKAAATEDAFRQQAASAAYLHLATHGFFAPPSVKRGDVPHTDFLAAQSDAGQSFEGWNPGLLSGIVLAGVNRPVDGSRDDGIVTAAEVADLNLAQAQLVVLSACETGLGQIAGGEGALGLQRAFQVAGARSVVSSLWKVDDTATQLLMTQFYENLWVKKLPPLAAFREAQLSLLHGKVDTTKLRGLDVEAKKPQPDKEDGRLSPRLWAAFVVSGGL